MAKRNVYLNMKSIKEGKEIMFEKFLLSYREIAVEEIDSVDALGRTLAQPAVAALSSPNFHAAAMDGIAVNAKITFGAGDDSPKQLLIGRDAFWINTGHLMPEGTDAVIMVEHLNILNSSAELSDADTPESNNFKERPKSDEERQQITHEAVEIHAPAVPWQNVRKMGEDIVATELLFPRGEEITPYAIGALIAGGIFRVKVARKPNVLIIPTGSELKSWQDTMQSPLKPGEVIESNAAVLGALCTKYGATFEKHEIIRDNPELITEEVRRASYQENRAEKEDCSGSTNRKYDAVFIIGGSSAGSKDYSKTVISSLGEVYLHGVTMMPGKPLIFGGVNNVPVFGIPGYPVSAIVAFEQFAGPLLLRMQGIDSYSRDRITTEVEPARKIASRLGVEEFLRVKIGAVDERLIASSLPRGSGSITTLTQADGIIRIPSNTEGIGEGEKVQAELIRPLSAIRKTVVITGSHDNTLDLLADHIRRTREGVSISSSHVGSMGGLMAIRRKSCHMAGVHLLDPADGSYNISYVKKYLPGEKVWLINLVMREQGLIIPKGNPEKIEGLEDIRDRGLSFINRQGGAGTRILLDYKLRERNISPSDINGYSNEEYTHMSVAAAVLSGRADAGLGIHAASRALDLDFIPVITEEYDLAIPDRFMENENIRVLLDTINDEKFKERVRALGGYSTDRTGEVILNPDSL